MTLHMRQQVGTYGSETVWEEPQPAVGEDMR